MKKAKLKKLLVEAQEAHKQSSAALKEISRRTTEVKKTLKEKKRLLANARKDYKSTRKVFRELTASFKEARAQHLKNNKHLEKLSKKSAKLGTTATAKAPSGAKAKRRRVQPAKKKVAIQSVAAPQIVFS